MKIEKQGDLYRASHVPGPSHNCLWLRLGMAPADSFPIEVRAPIGEYSPDPLTADDVRSWIKQGIALANQQLGTNYAAIYAAIVENDSRRFDVYASMARAIVCAAHEDRTSS